MKILLSLCLVAASASLCTAAVTSWASANYTIWSLPDDLQATVQIKVPQGLSYLAMMQVAATVDHTFDFDVKYVTGVGHYITSISGLAEVPSENRRWMLYNLGGPPDVANPPGDELLAPKGVDSMFVNDGDNILFWLRVVDSPHPL